MSIAKNISDLIASIPPHISIVAATKNRSIDEINEAIDAGIKIIGENYVKEAEHKYESLKGKAEFHCIGHLQTNKIKKAVEIFDMIQTVDSFKIAEEIDRKCSALDKTMPVLIEVNSGEEKQKSGLLPDKVIGFVRKTSCLKNIRIKGLMTMAPQSEDTKKISPYFKKTKELFDKIKNLNMPNVNMEFLSMGMSDSYKLAVKEGSTMIRIGTKIFGRN